jgi:L-ascorbate metabolism protein UlaG (beta-lactamase superfamily)
MNRDRLVYMAVVLVLITFLAGCGTPATPTAFAPTAQVAATAVPPSPVPTTPPTPVALPKDATITLTWFGQATFVLKTSTGLNSLLDPAGPGTGYDIPTQSGIDLVTVSHEHSDHNAVSLADGSPIVLHGLAGNDWAEIDQTVKGVRVRTVGVYHDDTLGSQRGKNAIFVFDVDGLRLAHLGDLGHTLSPEQIKEIGPVDVILIPVGGFYTVDGKAATEVVSQLNPKIVIPMHYKTADLSPSLAGQLAPVDDFIKAMGNTATVSEVGQTVTIERGKLPAGRTIMVMKYKSS